jgi:hypothetical protein
MVCHFVRFLYNMAQENQTGKRAARWIFESPDDPTPHGNTRLER